MTGYRLNGHVHECTKISNLIGVALPLSGFLVAVVLLWEHCVDWTTSRCWRSCT